MNGILDLLTGIELHTCNKWWGGTTYGMYASFFSPETENTKCTTQDLMTYQIMHRGEWMDYNGYILGECSHFLLNLKNNVCTGRQTKLCYFWRRFRNLIYKDTINQILYKNVR